MDDEATAFSPSGWLEKAKSKVTEELKPHPNLFDVQDSQACFPKQSHESGCKWRSDHETGLQIHPDTKESTASDIALMSGARGPRDSPKANSLSRISAHDDIGVYDEMQNNRYHLANVNRMPPDTASFPQSANEHLSKLDDLNSSNVPMTETRNTKYTDTASQMESEQLSSLVSDSQAAPKGQNEPQSAEMEISPTDLFHSCIIQSKPHLLPTSAEETQSHHPSILPRSPQSSQKHRRSSPQRSYSKGNECEATSSYESISSSTPAQMGLTSMLRDGMQNCSQSSEQDQHAVRPSSFMVPTKPQLLPSSLNDRNHSCTSPTDLVSITATTNSPFPRPGTPRPFTPNTLRLSVERDFTGSRFVRESTPAYLDRSYTPSPVSRVGDSEIPMFNVPTPTPSRYNYQASGDFSGYSGDTHIPTQVRSPNTAVAFSNQELHFQSSSQMPSLLPHFMQSFSQPHQNQQDAILYPSSTGASHGQQNHTAPIQLISHYPIHCRNEPPVAYKGAFMHPEGTVGHSKWAELQRTLEEGWPPKGTIRHKKPVAGLGSGAKVEKLRATARAVSHGRPRKSTIGKKQRAVTTSVPVTKMKPSTDPGSMSDRRRIDSSDHTAKKRDAEGEGKRRSARIKQRRSEGRDVIYSE